jgi:transposase
VSSNASVSQTRSFWSRRSTSYWSRNPSRIIEKCLAGDQIVIETVVGKYCNHTPLHRQSMILERDLGLEISRATLDGWVLKVGELLIPMVAAMRRELISGTYIQADETPVDVQTREGRGQNHQAYLWQYSHPGGTVVFDFRLGRGRDGPKRFLGRFEGTLQTDGYAAYDQIGGTSMVHAACWAHARRQFFEAVQLNPRDPVATPIVTRMDELFAIDAEARLTWRRIQCVRLRSVERIGCTSAVHWQDRRLQRFSQSWKAAAG